MFHLDAARDDRRVARRGTVPREDTVMPIPFARLVLTTALLLPASAHAASPAASSAPAPVASPTMLIRDAFAAWADGRGSVFDLLADDVEWQVAGVGPVSGRYVGRAAFLEHAVAPITARLATPIVPQVQAVVADGDAVVVLWHGRATARDGRPYENQYAWHMTVADGRITHVVAFLDTWALHDLLRD